MLAWMATGLEKVTCCHPEGVSALDVAVASNWPVLLHRLTVWGPLLRAPL